MFQVPQNGVPAAQEQHQNCIIDPNKSVFYWWWQQALVLLSFYFCFVSSMLGTFSAPLPPPRYVWITNSAVSLLFLFDIGLSFFVAYIDKNTFAMVKDRRRIVMKNAKTFLLRIILILIVPFEVIATQKYSACIQHRISCRGYHVIIMLPLLRFFYSRRIHRWFSELEENERINFNMVRIAKMMWVCYLVCHYGGCVFYLMATFHAHVENTWFSLVDLNFVTLGLINKYVTSMYYAVISFTTVGYGDLHPVYIDEKVFSVIFLLADFGLVAYVATTIVYLVAPDVGPLGKYRARRARVLGFCRQNGLPDELCIEVSSHLKQEYLSQSHSFEESSIMESLPTTIKKNILIALSNAVKNNILFNHLTNSTQFQLIQAMEPVFFPASTSIILENEAPMFLYFVVRGFVDLIPPGNFENEDTVIITVRPGEVFGETCLFFNTPQVFAAIARESSHLLMLDRVKLLNILEGCVNDTSWMISDYIQALEANNNPYMNRVLLDFEKRAEIGNIDLPVSLWFALNRRYYRLFDILVEKYQDPNGCDIKGRTAMHLAASRGEVEKVNMLLRIGADPNLKDLAGIVPLWNAMLGRHANVVQALEYYGCTLKSCHLGKYAYIVASRGNMDLLQIIGQENDQFLSVPNFRGETALHAAVYLGDLPMIQYLVEMGVQIIRNDDYGHSPLSLAEIHGDEEIQNYLEEKAMLFDHFF
ncbi:potassium channel AKT1 [Trifolium repens]|nr:potassium channel AKT1 [Trifolium repens]